MNQYDTSADLRPYDWPTYGQLVRGTALAIPFLIAFAAIIKVVAIAQF